MTNDMGVPDREDDRESWSKMWKSSAQFHPHYLDTVQKTRVAFTL